LKVEKILHSSAFIMPLHPVSPHYSPLWNLKFVTSDVFDEVENPSQHLFDFIKIIITFVDAK